MAFAHGPHYACGVEEHDFHDALNAAISSNERYAEAKATVDRSKKLRRDSEGLIGTSRELVRAAKNRIAKHELPPKRRSSAA